MYNQIRTGFNSTSIYKKPVQLLREFALFHYSKSFTNKINNTIKTTGLSLAIGHTESESVHISATRWQSVMMGVNAGFT